MNLHIMKFAGLISGGKDSIFSIQTLINQGHTLICVGNVAPPVKYKELDSFMYQSAGNEIVPKIAECLGVPFYQVTTSGEAVTKELEYSETAKDEVEDLFKLMRLMQKNHPEIEAVSSGAIASTYQKNRVENLCGRLSWKSLAPIWKKDFKPLLEEMIDSGIVAILVRVCSYGLKKKHLGKTLGELKPYLHSLHDKYDVNCCGEGGEFETLVIDAPVYKKKLNIFESEVDVHLDNGIQYVAKLIIKKAELINK